ncbi:HAD-IA family hydrolase [Trichothermofontia sp.]
MSNDPSPCTIATLDQALVNRPDRPPVVLLDAVGTLFGVRDSVGAVYREVASQFGVAIDALRLDHAFVQAFAAAPPMAFPGVERDTLYQQEFQWWQTLAIETFAAAGYLEQFQDFDAFFQALYDHFATAQPWFVYPEVPTTLAQWREAGIQLGVLSNFDSRLFAVLETLGLAEFFTTVTISTAAGAAKPDPQVFAIALQKHDCPPAKAIHIGDSYRADYQGAQQAGLQAFWLRRQNY